MNKLIIFSGAQPSGKLTVANYIGAIRQWVKMQNNYQCIYCIVDLHALTNSNSIDSLHQTSLDTLALYLACGINPNVSTIFVQSHVAEHSQLNWILNCCAYFGEMKRMTQFKEKLTQCSDDINVGLFNYPILMASDILLYQTNLVPVGDDQKQHLELTQNIAKRFNHRYGQVFTIPQILVPKFGSRIMSLLDPKKKMSKSDKNSNNYITLLDDADLISKKIGRAVTDSDSPPIIQYAPCKKPGISNLLSILSGITENSVFHLEKIFKKKTYSQLKTAVIQELSFKLTQLQCRYYFERSDEKRLNRILSIGAQKARNQAKITLQKVNRVIGIDNNVRG